MKKSHHIGITILIILILAMCVFILGVLLFRQSAIPKFNMIKGDQGDPPTAQQVSEAVIQYFKSNPPTNGVNGASATTEQIAIAVADYLKANPPAAGAKGDTVVGVNGINGLSCTTQSVEGGAIILCEDSTSSFISNGVNGTDGKTPLLRCNASKNRWEIRYSEEDNWTILKDQNEKSVRCTVAL